MSSQERKMLWGRSGNVCAFPGCGMELAQRRRQLRTLGEEAHIKGEKPTAARFDGLQSPQERDAYENRILLCPTHHVEVDADPGTWTVEALQAAKNRHEEQVTRNRGFPSLLGDLNKLVQRYSGPEPGSESAVQDVIQHRDGVTVVRVDARLEGGIDTGLDLAVGQRVTFFARGLITYDSGRSFASPEGIICNEFGIPYGTIDESRGPAPAIWPHPDAYKTDGGQLGRIGSLIGWVGPTRDDTFRIGARRELVVKAGGRLHLAVNDARGTYSDNDGEFRVDIRIRVGPG